LIVDIGGSIGHDIDEFRRKFPNTPGDSFSKTCLSSSPNSWQLMPTNTNVERTLHDFYKE
jgi:hypothetical protein